MTRKPIFITNYFRKLMSNFDSTENVTRFPVRSCNIQDPLDSSNNLGTSVIGNNLFVLCCTLQLACENFENILRRFRHMNKNVLLFQMNHLASSPVRAANNNNASSAVPSTTIPSTSASSNAPTQDGNHPPTSVSASNTPNNYRSSSPVPPPTPPGHSPVKMIDYGLMKEFFPGCFARYMHPGIIRADMMDHPLQQGVSGANLDINVRETCNGSAYDPLASDVSEMTIVWQRLRCSDPLNSANGSSKVESSWSSLSPEVPRRSNAAGDSEIPCPVPLPLALPVQSIEEQCHSAQSSSPVQVSPELSTSIAPSLIRSASEDCSPSISLMSAAESQHPPQTTTAHAYHLMSSSDRANRQRQRAMSEGIAAIDSLSPEDNHQPQRPHQHQANGVATVTEKITSYKDLTRVGRHSVPRYGAMSVPVDSEYPAPNEPSTATVPQETREQPTRANGYYNHMNGHHTEDTLDSSPLPDTLDISAQGDVSIHALSLQQPSQEGNTSTTNGVEVKMSPASVSTLYPSPSGSSSPSLSPSPDISLGGNIRNLSLDDDDSSRYICLETCQDQALETSNGLLSNSTSTNSDSEMRDLIPPITDVNTSSSIGSNQGEELKKKEDEAQNNSADGLQTVMEAVDSGAAATATTRSYSHTNVAPKSSKRKTKHPSSKEVVNECSTSSLCNDVASTITSPAVLDLKQEQPPLTEAELIGDISIQRLLYRAVQSISSAMMLFILVLMVAVTYLVLSPTIRPYVPSKHDPTRSKGGMTQSSTVSASNAAVYWVRAGSTISVAAPCACDVAEDQTLTISDDENEELEGRCSCGASPGSSSSSGAPVAWMWQWQRDGQDVTDANEAVLTLHNITVDDGGMYRCLRWRASPGTREGRPQKIVVVYETHIRVSGELPSSITYIVLVHYKHILSVCLLSVRPMMILLRGGAEPPFARTKPSHHILTVGQDLFLHLNSSGQPPPSFQWMRNGYQLPRQMTPALVVRQVTKEHEGTYSCKLENTAGSYVWLEATVIVRELR